MRRWHGSAADFHARPADAVSDAEVWVFEVTRPALVIGSSQPEATVDEAATAAAGIELVRRRSGGGAVLLDPGDVVWFDAVVPATRLRAEGVGDDVPGAMRWFGARLAAAATAVGIDAAVHGGPMMTTRWSPLVCFDGLGPGELVIGDAKVAGVSARRTRSTTRFQCAVPLAWRPQRLVGLLAPPRPEVAELRPVVVAAATAAAAMPAALADALA